MSFLGACFFFLIQVLSVNCMTFKSLHYGSRFQKPKCCSCVDGISENFVFRNTVFTAIRVKVKVFNFNYNNNLLLLDGFLYS